jgi:vacuolar-type H+-ATPase subunit H
MIKDIIDQIKESENKAKDIIASSKKESSEIIEKAYQKANRQVRDAELRAKKLLKQAEEKAAGDARAQKAELEAEYDRRIKAIRDDSRIKEEEAIQKLVDKVLG